MMMRMMTMATEATAMKTILSGELRTMMVAATEAAAMIAMMNTMVATAA